MKKLILAIIAFVAFQVQAQQVKTPFYEVFTSATCGPCNPGNANLKSVLSNYPDQYILLKYQMNWPSDGDDYYTDEAGDRRSHYRVSSVPNMFIDGETEIDPRNLTDTEFESHLNKPSKMVITVWDSVDAANQTVHYDVRMTPTDTINSVAYRAYIAIAEKVTYKNKATNGETEFIHVMKKMVLGGTGEFILASDGALTPDTSYSYIGAYAFQGSYDATTTADNPVDHSVAHTVEDFDNLFVVAWFEDVQSKEVIQAWTSLLNEENTTGIEVAEERLFKVYPNPSTGLIRVQLNADLNGETFRVFDLQGREVSTGIITETSAQTLDLNSLSGGLYVLQIGSETTTISLNK